MVDFLKLLLVGIAGQNTWFTLFPFDVELIYEYYAHLWILCTLAATCVTDCII